MQSDDRDRGAEETATAALAQLISTTEAFERRAAAAEARDAIVAGSLHDMALQSLTTAFRFLEAARSSLASSSPEAAAIHVDDAQAAVQAAIREVREAIEGLRPTEAGR